MGAPQALKHRRLAGSSPGNSAVRTIVGGREPIHTLAPAEAEERAFPMLLRMGTIYVEAFSHLSVSTAPLDLELIPWPRRPTLWRTRKVAVGLLTALAPLAVTFFFFFLPLMVRSIHPDQCARVWAAPSVSVNFLGRSMFFGPKPQG